MKQFQPIYLLIVKLSLINSHYWPTGYNSLSSDHTWSWSPSTHQIQPHQPQPVLSAARPFSISRNSFYSSKTNKWPVQGKISSHFELFNSIQLCRRHISQLCIQVWFLHWTALVSSLWFWWKNLQVHISFVFHLILQILCKISLTS